MTCLKDKLVKTRKDHLCFGCQRKFLKGSELHSRTSVDQGDIWTTYLCHACNEIIHIIFDNWELEEGIFAGAVCDDMADNKFEGTPEEYLELLEKENTP